MKLLTRRLLVVGAMNFLIAKILAADDVHPALYPAYSNAEDGLSDFRPLGFSPDGHFAYLLIRPGLEEISNSIRIKDLVTDQEVTDLWGLYGEAEDKKWILRQSVFLRKFKISPLSNRSLQLFPLKTEEDEYNAIIRWTPREEAVWIQILLTSLRHGGKKVSSYLYKKKDCQNPDTSTGNNAEFVNGYYSSPFEKRILIVISGRCEDPDVGETELSIFGAHLSKGFKPMNELEKELKAEVIPRE